MPRNIAGVPVTRIGALRSLRAGKPRIAITYPGKAPTELKPAGWEHFSR
jgi:thiamine-monophosphate kinase